MPQQYPQVVSPVSLTPPMKTRRSRPMDAQGGASSNTTSTTISTAGSSDNNSPKNRRARRGSNASPTRPVPAKRSTLDSWFLRDSLTPASARSEGSRSPLRSLSPDAPFVGKTGRVYGVGQVPSPENGRKGRVVELSGSPSSSLSSRVPTSGSAAVATVTPPGLKSSCGGGDVRSLTDLPTTPPPRGNRLARRSRRRTVSASFEQGSSRALTRSPEGSTISASTSRRRSSKRCPTSAPVPAISGGSAKIKSDPAKGRDTFTRSAKAPRTSNAAHDSANPKRSTNIQVGSFPTARTEGEASAKNPVTSTPDDPLAPCASSAADPGPRGRPAKKRASLFGSTPPPCTSGPVVRSPRNVCHVSTVTGCSGVSSCATGVPVAEKMRHDGRASSGKPALARTPSSKAAAPRKRKSIAKPTVRRSGPLVVGASGGMGWKKKDTGDKMEGVGAKLKGKLGQPSASSMPSTKGIGDGAASAGEVFEVGAPAGENGSVQAVGMRPSVKGSGVAGRENEDVPPKKRKAAASLDEEQYVTKETCRARSAGGEGTSKSGDDAGVALAGDPRRLEAAPLGAATLTEAGTRDVFDAPLFPAATASAGTTSASASQSTLADSPSVTPLGRAALTITGVPSTTSHIDEGEQKLLEKLGRSVTAAVDSRDWTPPGTADETVAMASKAPQTEGEGQVETHIMAGQAVHLKCSHCRTRFSRAGCSTASCLDCCFKAAVPCAAHAKQLERKRLEEELLAAGPSREERRRLAKGVFKEEAIHAIGDTATLWCFGDFLCARSNQGAFKTLSRKQRAVTGRRARLSTGRLVASSKIRASLTALRGPAGALGESSRRVRPSIARWRRKSAEMLATVASGSAPFS